MSLSPDRISHLAHLLLEGLRREGLIEIRDPGTALSLAKETLQRLAAEEDEIDSLVRERLQKQKKNPGPRDCQELSARYVRD